MTIEEARSFWAFRPPERPPVPAVTDPELARQVAGPIDAFLLARLEAEGLSPAPLASDREIARRVWFDLLGLSPSYEELEAYVHDPAPDKYERLVDRLLARPEYGERQAQHWLDVVRFAQSSGYERDKEKDEAWRYRDWVVSALNADLPYDRFLRAQIAGDERPQEAPDALVATGIYHLGLWDSEPDDPAVRTYDLYDDMLRVVGEGVLGLTVGCARCHDHRFDPLPTEDYYGLLAFVRGVQVYRKPRFELDAPCYAPLGATAEDLARRESRREVERKRRQEALERFLEEQRRSYVERRLAELPAEVGAAWRTPPAERTEAQRRLLAAIEDLPPSRAQLQKSFDRDTFREFYFLDQAVQEIDRSFPGSLDWVLCAREAGAEPPPTHVLHRGRPDSPGPPVRPHFPRALCPNDEAAYPEIPAPPPGARSSGRRSVLADWLTSPENPLTARVIVNRLWQIHFGAGIVATPNDFGTRGAAPTHPELLDWLASELVARGWSLKALHREILLSTAYRRTSHPQECEASRRDPQNRLLWRQRPRRLDAEALRDAMLLASGELGMSRGGRGYFPRVPREVLAGASRPGEGWEVSSLAERNRRALYRFRKRGVRDPVLELFDCPEGAEPVGRRVVTTTPSQALTLWNGMFTGRVARSLAARVAAQAPASPREWVRRAFELVLARAPSEQETASCVAFLAAQEADFARVLDPLRFRPLVPRRLQFDFLRALPPAEALFGPRQGWTYVLGRWDLPYNDTREASDLAGPAALLEAPAFADGTVRARVRLAPDTSHAGLLLRAHPHRGGFVGYQLVLDSAAGRLGWWAHTNGEEEPHELAGIDLAIPSGDWLAIEVALEGATASVRVEGQERLRVRLLENDTSGRLGFRAVGGTLEVAALELTSGETTLRVQGDPTGSPAHRALESLCTVLLQSNELAWVD